MDSTITGRAYELSVMIRERGAKEFKECRVLEFSDLHVDEAEMTQQLKDTLETDTLTKFVFYKEHTIEVDDLEEGVPYKAAVSITAVMRSIVLYLEKGSNRGILPTRYQDIHDEGICMAFANVTAEAVDTEDATAVATVVDPAKVDKAGKRVATKTREDWYPFADSLIPKYMPRDDEQLFILQSSRKTREEEELWQKMVATLVAEVITSRACLLARLVLLTKPYAGCFLV